ncbi:MAG: metallophosphoesterase [Candidatus Woesearchaeota archaeon]
MIICAIGDPHGDLEKIKKIPLHGVDLILVTGDIGKSDLIRKMTFENIKRQKEGQDKIKYTLKDKKNAYMETHTSTIKIIDYLSKHAPVLTIFGNVESTTKDTLELSKQINEDLPYLTRELIKIKNVRIINNKLANINGLKIGGLQYFIDTNWVEEFKPKNYEEKMKIAKHDTKKAKKILNWFDELDILVCHQPPHGILDKVNLENGAPKEWNGKRAGSKTILEYIKTKNPKYVFCGHIHEGAGNTKINETKIYNLGVCNYKKIKLNPKI